MVVSSNANTRDLRYRDLSDKEFYNTINILLTQGKTLAAILYQEKVIGEMVDEEALSNRLSYYHQTRLYAGQWREAQASLNERGDFESYSGYQFADRALFDSLEPQPAIAEIVAEAKNRQIVILNESHYRSDHRNFAKRLARELRKVGYKWLAVEAFNDFATPISELSRRGFPVRSDGDYLNDPVFADFIRTSLEIGFQPVRYEINQETQPVDDHFRYCDDRSDIQPLREENTQAFFARVLIRERQQACNIYRRVFEKDPAAKVFIFVGHGHLWETISHGDGGVQTGMMGGFLKEYSGLDPLTIDQTHGSASITVWLRGNVTVDRGAAQYVPLNLAILETFDFNKPTVFRRKDGGWLVSPLYTGRVDMTLYHPRFRDVDGRPGWLANDPARRKISVRPFSVAAGHPIIVEAVIADEGVSAIPVDQIFDRGNSREFTLFLPEEGTFNLRLQCPGGKFLDLGTVILNETGERWPRRPKTTLTSCGAHSSIEPAVRAALPNVND